jgi:hypothetical protein
MDLYVFYLGGNAGKSNIEVHDIQFAAVERPENAWPMLRQAWFGDKDKIHIDGYGRLLWADGYSIHLSQTPSGNVNKLYFVNVGGYRGGHLAELHEFGFFVAENASQAKAKALATLLTDSEHQHKDNLKDVDDCLLLESVNGYYVHLTAQDDGVAFQPEWQGYQPIGK